jgi:hypothetical protein
MLFANETAAKGMVPSRPTITESATDAAMWPT